MAKVDPSSIFSDAETGSWLTRGAPSCDFGQPWREGRKLPGYQHPERGHFLTGHRVCFNMFHVLPCRLGSVMC